MNDQHTHAGYTGYATGSFDSDPLFGALPGSYEEGHSGQYDSTQWSTGSQPTTGYEAYATAEQAQQPQYDQQYDATGQWDANAWNQSAHTGQYETAAATFAYDTTGHWATPGYDTGAYDATVWNSGAATGTTGTAEAFVPQQFTPEQEFVPVVGYDTTGYGANGYEAAGYETDSYGATGPEAGYDAGYESGYDATAEFQSTEFQDPDLQDTDFQAEAAPESEPEAAAEYDYEYTYEAEDAAESGTEPDSEAEDEHDALTRTMVAAVPSASITPRPVRRSGGSRGRRRTPAKRSALLTVAVPSACVMGVAGIAAASVGNLNGAEAKDETANLSAAEPDSVKPIAANSKMDTQLAALSADARDFGDRASRTQERLDLKARQEAEKKKREAEAARREALRPKFVLPVKQDGLSAYYGQSGVNWMSLHTGIDFPVQYGTEVLAATDGTVRTQWNSAYGNMAIVTAADGTETWYCHLSTTKIRSGSVKAGDVIAYSGNSGNSTGPHLHFEVRPGGGSAIDPLPWLRSHGLNPT
ncbi:peptidoglycan DD-metalloendopeptidase family protein [Streptomyces sp. NPDC002889]|uniref:peptidoglycan DD-metalloendopeptidase family protein n=1 Tax=Streptomyces sp. NPDC002889 TaxID=3364669 RepID=UPI00367C7FFF